MNPLPSVKYHLKKTWLIILFVMTSTSFIKASNPPLTVSWEVIENGVKPNFYSNRFVITNSGDKTLGNNWEFYYNHFSRKIELPAGSPVVIDEIRPSYYRMRPSDKFQPLAPGESVNIDMNTRGIFINYCYGPDGGYFIDKKYPDKPVAIKIIRPVMNDPKQWTVPGRKSKPYPDGNYIYNLNKKVNPENAKYEGGMYDIFPTPKSTESIGGNTIINKEVRITSQTGLQSTEKYLTDKLKSIGIEQTRTGNATEINLKLLPDKSANKEYYELRVENNAITIEGTSAAGVLNGIKTLIAVLEKNELPVSLPNVLIKDYPDLEYRGMMLDIARNFTTFDNIKTLIDRLASYKINKFHFHFSDDEGWRLEIPGLPELTQVGSRRGHTLDENEFLFQTFTGTGNPDDNSTGNGYYTRKQFIELLKYASQRGIDIIPEIESPGHARAAIYSMKARYNKYRNTDRKEAAKYIIWDDKDTSVYTSAQNFHDNVLDISSEGTYNFMEKVIDELISMYKDAGVELAAIHIGGDEVPHGSWEGSPNVADFMKKRNMKNVHEAGEYFLTRVTKILDSKGVKANGWQEVAMHHPKNMDKEIAPRFAGVNVWSTVGKNDTVAYSIANAGYDVILSNVNNLYLDMSYTPHQYEPGLNWGGYVDEFASWNTQPFNNYRSERYTNTGEPANLNTAADGKPQLTESSKKHIKGLEAHIFSEAIRNYDMVEYYTFPKILGMVERSWNAEPSWGKEYSDMTKYDNERIQYNLKIGTMELPRLHRKKSNFRVWQPGITIIDGLLHANAIYPGVEIRSTTDGSEPTINSTRWTEPVPCNAKLIKAKSFYLGKQSLTTYLFQ